MALQWYGPQFLAHLEHRMATKIHAGGEACGVEMRHNISVQGPPVSTPGHPPHIDTGDLLKSIVVAFDPASMTVRIGSTIDYAIFLEQGTHNMAARPFIVMSLMGARVEIVQAMAAA